MRDAALTRAIEIAGGQTALAQKLGLTSQAVNQWERAPVSRVLEIEAATKMKVSRHELRPDIYPENQGGQPAGQPNGAESETAAASDSDKVPAGGKVSAPEDAKPAKDAAA